jgi:hypothetical protein
MKLAGFCASNVAHNLMQSLFETLRGLQQLALKGFDLLRYVLELSFGNQASLRHLVSRAISLTHRSPNFHRDLPELAFFGHLYPPHETISSYTIKRITQISFEQDKSIVDNAPAN